VLQLRVAVCGDVPKVTLEGEIVQVRPAGVDDTVNDTVPVRPLSAVTVIVDVPDEPASIWAGVAPAATVKSTTVKVMAAVA
jgi:hypothetical protein